MGRVSADNIIFDFGMYLLIAVPFGLAVGGPDVSNMLNTIFGTWPTFQQTVNAIHPATTSCAAWDWGCSASQGVAQATAFIGAAIAYPGVLAGSALNRISTFGNLATFITLGPTTSVAAIPIVGPLLVLALVIVIAFELFRMFRGSSVGA